MSDWDTPLFGCFEDIKVLIFSYVFGICTLAQQKVTLAKEGEKCGFMDMIMAYICFPCTAVTVRGQIREKYNIAGSCFGDLITLWICGICAISQQVRQMQKKGTKPAGFMIDD